MEKKTRVLIIDDAPFILKVTDSLLTNAGFDVKTADSGMEGLVAWKDWCPDVVLLDLMMPDKSGWEIIETAKADPDYTRASVIIYSAKDDPEARTGSLQRGAYAFILKPCDNDELARTIRAAAGVRVDAS